MFKGLSSNTGKPNTPPIKDQNTGKEQTTSSTVNATTSTNRVETSSTVAATLPTQTAGGGGAVKSTDPVAAAVSSTTVDTETQEKSDLRDVQVEIGTAAEPNVTSATASK